MDDKQRLDLSKMIKEYQSEETTDKIRQLKHSKLIRDDVTTIFQLKKQYQRMEKNKNSSFKDMCKTRCAFIYKNYMNIFNKLLNDELDLSILQQFLTVLSRIENGEIDQHEGSYVVGDILKKLYIDSAIRHKEKEDKKLKNNKHNNTDKSKKAKNLSWNEYKRTLM